MPNVRSRRRWPPHVRRWFVARAERLVSERRMQDSALVDALASLAEDAPRFARR